MTRRHVGTIGHSGFDGGMGLAAAIGLLTVLQSKPRPPRELTPQEIANSYECAERQRWNDEVDARKAAKKAGTS